MVLAEKREMKPFNAVYYCKDCGRKKTVPCTSRELSVLFSRMGVIELLDCFNCDNLTDHRFSGRFEPNHQNRKKGFGGEIRVGGVRRRGGKRKVKS